MSNKNIAGLHFITMDCDKLSHQEQVKQACLGNIKCIQLRIKDKKGLDLEAIFAESLKICRKFGVVCIINDYVRLAKHIGADGVHIGKQDMDFNKTKAFLGNDFIIGATANTFEDINHFAVLGADYIGLGPYKYTKTKSKLSPVIGLPGYKAIINQLYKLRTDKKYPYIIAVGGIELEDVQSLMNIGLDGVAVSSAIALSENIQRTVESFEKEIKNNKVNIYNNKYGQS